MNLPDQQFICALVFQKSARLENLLLQAISGRGRSVDSKTQQKKRRL